MGSEYRERYATQSVEHGNEYADKEKRTVVGIVVGEPHIEYYEEIGRDDRSQAELQFTVRDDDGEEFYVSYRVTILETELPKLKAGETIALYGDRTGNKYFEVESYAHTPGQ